MGYPYHTSWLRRDIFIPRGVSRSHILCSIDSLKAPTSRGLIHCDIVNEWSFPALITMLPVVDCRNNIFEFRLDYIIHCYRATCPLNLEYFPMDKQMCTLEIESFGYTMSGAQANLPRLKWSFFLFCILWDTRTLVFTENKKKQSV